MAGNTVKKIGNLDIQLLSVGNEAHLFERSWR